MPKEEEDVTHGERSAKLADEMGVNMKSWWIGISVVLGVILLAAGTMYYFYDSLPDYWQGIAVEAGGLFLDAVLILAAFGGYEKWRGTKDEIARLKERIEDVKRIDDAHAKGIVASAIRGLARYKITDIDLRGAKLSSFSFHQNDIASLAGAVISNGFYFNKASRNFAELTHVDFSWTNCQKTCFGSGNLSLATYDSCDFGSADLRGAKFEGVALRWPRSEVRADETDWFEEVDVEPDGTPIHGQMYSPAFDGADLAGCSFKGARLAYADFRGAKHVDQADFTDATGLETCFFDDALLATSLTSKRKSFTV